MPVNRELFREPFYIDSVPPWPCPRCNVGVLVLTDKEWLRITPDATSRGNMSEESDATEIETGVCACIVMCNHENCREACAIAAKWQDEMESFEGEPSAVAVCRPVSITPAPPMVHVPKGCPDDIRKEVTAAFSAFWSDLSSSLNHLRQALELLLTATGVPGRKQQTKSGKISYTRLSAHDRIVWLQTRRPALARMCDRLLAVKHLGNAGSHSGSNVTDSDVFDALDIFEQILAERFERKESIDDIVAAVNKKRGPRKVRQ